MKGDASDDAYKNFPGNRPSSTILLDRLDNIRPAPGMNDFSHFPGFTLRGLKQLHIQFDKV